LRQPLRREFGQGSAPPGRSEAPSQRGIVGEREDRFGDGIWVVGGDQHAFASRLDQLFEAADARGHHRPARQHCLQAGRVSGLLPSWEHNDVHQTQERGRVIAVAREHGP
jgi:hypothetical protein